MAHGLEVYNSAGVRTISINDTMYLVLFTVLAPVLTNGSATVPGANSTTCRAIVHAYSDAQVMIPHNVSITQDTVTWTSGHPSWGCRSMIIVVSTPV